MNGKSETVQVAVSLEKARQLAHEVIDAIDCPVDVIASLASNNLSSLQRTAAVHSATIVQPMTIVGTRKAPAAAMLPRKYLKRDANKNKRWTEDQKQFLRDNFISKAQGSTKKCAQSVKKIMKHVRKTKCAVLATAQSLGLTVRRSVADMTV